VHATYWNLHLRRPGGYTHTHTHNIPVGLASAIFSCAGLDPFPGAADTAAAGDTWAGTADVAVAAAVVAREFVQRQHRSSPTPIEAEPDLDSDSDSDSESDAVERR
jgi:hypothetical protein